MSVIEIYSEYIKNTLDKDIEVTSAQKEMLKGNNRKKSNRR